jgi:hypothetical protein
MKRFVLLFAVLAGLGLLAPAAHAKAQKGKAKTLVVDVLFEETNATFVDLNGNNESDPGDSFVGNFDVFRRGTSRLIGTAAFSSLVVSTEGGETSLFSAALRLNRGDIFLEGVTGPDDPLVVFDAIVGGTRKFKGARGQARETPMGEGDDTSEASSIIRVKLTYTTDRGRKK